MKATLLPIVLALLGLIAAVLPGCADAPAPAAQVFRLTAARDDGGLRLTWTIAPGNYLYRSRLKAATAAGAGVPLTTPPGETEDDPTFGPTEVYRNGFTATIAAGDVPAVGPIAITYQGCAERGLCYPPQTRDLDPLTLRLTPGGVTTAAPGGAEATTWAPMPPASTASPQAGSAVALTGALAPMLLTFLGLGVLLAFTPCVFPMIPILSGILTRSAVPLTARRGFLLSSTYAVAAALAYAVLGLAAAWSGQNLQAALQTPTVLGAMALVFILLALSSFGLFELQLPSAWTTRLSGLPGLRGGSLGGAAALGFASALVVGPCVTPPLAAALLYVAQGGDVGRGALALFALGLGMGLPLILIGTFGAGLLPRAGAWMVRVRQGFGAMFLGVAIVLLSRVVPGQVTLLLWALLGIGTGAALAGPAARPAEGWPGVLRRTGGVTATAYGLLLLVGVAGGASDPLRPLGFLTSAPTTAPTPEDRVTSVSALDRALAAAQAAARPVLLDYAADWCTSCRAIVHTLGTDPAVRRRLGGFRVVTADVTRNDPESLALLSRYGVIGMPTLVFLSGRDGTEVPGTRLIGEADPAALLRSLDSTVTDPDARS